MGKYKIDIEKKILKFKEPAGTSRGVYRTRTIWYVTLTDKEGRKGIGECAPLQKLSCDDIENYEEVFREKCDKVSENGEIDYEDLKNYPSMLFGIETAMLGIKNKGLGITKSLKDTQTSNILFDTPFARGEEGIPINGLVWMGTHDEMEERMKEKIKAGFKCIKLKIGAIEFESELDLIKQIRAKHSREEIELRVDANGGFSEEEAMERLEQLAQYDIHSIEQPIKQGHWKAMGKLCREGALDIALDEELIGVNDREEKKALLDEIRPQYIILKPSLHGGIKGTDEWIELARERGIGSWITSALESNVGLNAIAQLAAKAYGSKIEMPQGLGTGLLFEENADMGLETRGNKIWITASQ